MLAPDNLRWLAAIVLVVDALALASVWSSPAHSIRARVVWTAVILVVPLVGAGAWLLLGREPQRGRRR